MSDLKRFEDWEQVDCNECARYWDSSCDGVSKDTKKPCNSYLATRSVVIPAKIKKLEDEVASIRVACLISNIVLLAFIVLSLLRCL